MATCNRPNILLITTDQQRFDALGINGNRLIETTNLDALAAVGTNFSRAYSTTPSCIAARRTLLTGQHGVTHGLPGYRDGVEFFPKFTLPGLLGEAGYHTQLVGKLHQFPQRKRYGFDHLVLSENPDYRPGNPHFGQNDYVDFLRDAVGGNVDPSLHGIGANSRLARPFHLEERYHHTSWVVQEAIRFLSQKRDPSMPWFLHLSFWAPHPPLVPPSCYFERYEKRLKDWKPNMASWATKAPVQPGLRDDEAVGPFDVEQMRNALAGYYGLINHVDDSIAYLLGRCLPFWGSGASPTWILFTSDHGDLMGDHHLFRKRLPYEGSAHVPLFISSRQIPLERRSSDALVCLEDVCPTLLDMAGVPVPEGVDGKSLLPIVRGEAQQVRKTIFGEHSSPHSNHYIVHGRHKYCWFPETNEEQLFDLQNDPHELEDLSAQADLLQPFRQLLTERLRGRSDYSYDPAQLKPAANRPPEMFWKTK